MTQKVTSSDDLTATDLVEVVDRAAIPPEPAPDDITHAVGGPDHVRATPTEHDVVATTPVQVIGPTVTRQDVVTACPVEPIALVRARDERGVVTLE